MASDDPELAALSAQFPAWEFEAQWVSAGSGPDGRVLRAWPLEGGPAVTVEELRRQIRQAQP